jgi:hypothetical protein
MSHLHWRAWVHLTTATLGHWLPGDERGFRSRRHRVHSSSNQHNPPPPQEHAGLRSHASELSHGTVHLTRIQRRIAVEAMADKLERIGAKPRVIACDAVHCHALICWIADAKLIFGRAKQAASYALRDEVPGKVWGRSSHPVRIEDEEQYWTVIRYIKAHSEQGAFVWEREAPGGADGPERP